jgi:uncharacterized membrane protein YvbJ
MKYCPRCGAEVEEDVKFCPKCGYSFTGKQATSRRQRSEKGEKGEKQEKDEKGEKEDREEGLVGGLVLLWLGISFLLVTSDYIPWVNW